MDLNYPQMINRDVDDVYDGLSYWVQKIPRHADKLRALDDGFG